MHQHLQGKVTLERDRFFRASSQECSASTKFTKASGQEVSDDILLSTLFGVAASLAAAHSTDHGGKYNLSAGETEDFVL